MAGGLVWRTYDGGVDSDDAELTPDYPVEWETDVVLGDGSTASIRPIRPEDRDLLDAFHKRQSQESIYFRFFRYRPELSDRELDYFTRIDYEKRMAFVAILGGQIVAVARYEGWDSPNHPGEKRAEVAFFVDDEHHGKGIATIMLEFLAAAGRRQNFDGFTATVLPENVGMLRVFRRGGFDVSTGFADGVIEVDLGIDITDEATAAIENRERVAQARSIARLVTPASVAVIGASRELGAVGHELVRSISANGFTGTLHAVNSAAAGEEIAGVRAVASLADIEGSVDLAVIAIPAAGVEAAVQECIDAGVAGVVVVSVGFSDAGEEGRKREQRIVALARGNGLRLIGPNSFGLINSHPDVSLHAIFVPTEVEPGAVGLLSQSGPLGAGVLQTMKHRHVGLSSMVAVGNRADVSVNDMLSYWTEDEQTQVVALYLENYGNMRKFARIARGLSRLKPIVAVSPADETVAMLLRQSGVVLVDQVADLVTQSGVFVNQPLPAGNRVAIVSNAASVGRLAAQALRREGLEVVVPGAVASTGTDAVLVGDADTLDLSRSADFSIYEEALVGASVSSEVDMVLAALVPTPSISLERITELLVRIDRAVEKPLVATGLADIVDFEEEGPPFFPFPEDAAKALGRVADYVEWRELPNDAWIEADDDWAERARAAVSLALGSEDRRRLDLTMPEFGGLTNLLDLPISSYRVIAHSADPIAAAAAAGDAADELGYPVVVKASSVAMRSAGETGGVALDLHDRSSVEAAMQRMAELHGDALYPAIIQRQAQTGWHLRAELVQDQFGSRILLGVGGVISALIDNTLSISLPLSPAAIDHMIETTWLARTVGTQTGRQGLAELLGRLAAIADGVPAVAVLHVNPLLVSDAGVALVDASLTIRRIDEGPLSEVRHLS